MKRVLAIGDLATLDDSGGARRRTAALARPRVDALGSDPSFAFDLDRANVALDQMRAADDGPFAIDGGDWSQGAMAALLNAEFLAAEAGVVPWLTLPSGEKGILTVGAAREHIDDAPEDVRTMYLATHGLVRRTHAEARPWSDPSSPSDGVGAIPIVVVVGVVAIAAIIATAWYATRSSSIEVDGRNVRTTALASDAASIARDQLARTGKIDPGVWEVFKSIAETEAGHTWIPWAVGGLVVGGLGCALALKTWNSSRRTESRR